MARYIAGRVAQALLVLWAAYTATFIILDLLPGNPIATIASGGGQNVVTAAQIAKLERQYGLNEPLAEQYFTQLGHALTGRFGISYASGHTVGSMLAANLPNTLELAGCALLLAVLAGTGWAIAAVSVPWRGPRQLFLALPSVGISVPTFFMGLLLLEIFSFKLGWLPAFGAAGIDALVLPAVTLAIPTAALICQVLSKSLLTVLDEPFVEVARARGLGEVRVLLTHVLRNAALPALTVAGISVGNLIAGAVVVETVFSRNGIGRITAEAVSVQDTPVMQGVVLVTAAAYVGANLVVDLLYLVLDPRITVRAETGTRTRQPA